MIAKRHIVLYLMPAVIFTLLFFLSFRYCMQAISAPAVEWNQ